MTSDKIELTAAQLDALTAEVNVESGPGSDTWDSGASHTRRFNAAMIEEIRANGGKARGELADVPIVLVTMKGAKSGKTRTVPIGCWTVEGGRLVLVASMGGADRNPPWYHNLVANPEVTIEWQGETHRAVARLTEGEERDRLFNGVIGVMPVFAEYQQRTSRVLPVFELNIVD